ncbi:MAG: SAM-dependent methyltransferase, partial [Planctomycetes bacterium]|nr:SAM-dependent methyltransferase [Planctomycetota bacterium]
MLGAMIAILMVGSSFDADFEQQTGVLVSAVEGPHGERRRRAHEVLSVQRSHLDRLENELTEQLQQSIEEVAQSARLGESAAGQRESAAVAALQSQFEALKRQYAALDSESERLIVERIRDRGPLTTAEFMDLALYHPTLGYYSRAPHRTGREGDFFTSVDVGPQFGALLATQFDEMYRLLAATGSPVFDLVEVGAGNGQLARDLLDAAESTYPELYAVTRLTLVETSAAARAAQPDVLGRHRARLASSTATMPDRI